MKRKAVLLSLLSVACAHNASTSTQHAMTNKLELGDSDYSLSVPKVRYVKKIENGDVAATTVPDEPLASKDWRVEIFEKKFSPCTSLLTGSPKMTSLSKANGKADWGKVLFDESNIYDPNLEPLCLPPPRHSTPQEYWKTSSAYALCSEKNGKTVVICISQMKDDPAMAKQIFETFRWTQ